MNKPTTIDELRMASLLNHHNQLVRARIEHGPSVANTQMLTINRVKRRELYKEVRRVKEPDKKEPEATAIAKDPR